MPNVCLITHDDQPLILPAHEVCAIICVSDQTIAGAEGALTMIYTGFRGGTAYFLGQDPSDVFAEIVPADPNPDRWFVLEAELSSEAEASHVIDRSILKGYQGHSKGGLVDDRPWLEGFLSRPSPNPANRDATLAIKSTDENRATLKEILIGEGTARAVAANLDRKPRRKPATKGKPQ